MKSITVKNEAGWGELGEFPEKGFTIIYDDKFREASIFEIGKEECSKLFPKEDAELFWNDLMECDFQKVLIENEPMQGCDGYKSMVELSVGLQTVSLSLWYPIMNTYKEYHMTESMKLLKSIHTIISYVAGLNIAKDFEF